MMTVYNNAGATNRKKTSRANRDPQSAPRKLQPKPFQIGNIVSVKKNKKITRIIYVSAAGYILEDYPGLYFSFEALECSR